MAHIPTRHTAEDFTPADVIAVRHLVIERGLPALVVGWVFGAEESTILDVLDLPIPEPPEPPPPPDPTTKTIVIAITGTDYNVEVSEK